MAPDALDFGAIAVGQTVRRYVRITNLGFSELRLSGVASAAPELTTFFCAHADELLSNLDGTRTWQTVVDAEPALGMRLVGDDIDEALLAIADFVDLKSPYTLGHARAVAELVTGAATQLGMAEDEQQQGPGPTGEARPEGAHGRTPREP